MIVVLNRHRGKADATESPNTIPPLKSFAHCCGLTKHPHFVLKSDSPSGCEKRREMLLLKGGIGSHGRPRWTGFQVSIVGVRPRDYAQWAILVDREDDRASFRRH